MKNVAMLMVLLTVLFAGCAAQATEAVVDNGGAGFKVLAGEWNKSTRDPNYEGDNYLWCRKGDGSAKVTWKYKVPKKGTYQVFVKWVGSKPTDRATNAPFTVGGKTVRVDMSKRDSWGVWTALGEYTYEKDAVATVGLSNDANNSVVADAVKFVRKGADVVAAPKQPDKPGPKAAPGKGKVIFEDTFDKGIESWVLEKWDDKVQVGWKDKQLHLTTQKGMNGCMLWCKKKLPKNFIFEFDMKPLSNSGFFLVFFCTQGPKEKKEDKEGKDILSDELFKPRPAGTKGYKNSLFYKYVQGKINGYHISYRRGNSATCNFRKNSGLILLKQKKLKNILDKNKVVHVVLYKKGGHIKLTVNDTVFMDFVDDGKGGKPVWEGGRVGLRQVYDSDGLYDNVKITEIE